MKKRIPFWLCVSLTAVFSVLFTDNALSKTQQVQEVPRGITKDRAAALVGVAIGLTGLIVSLRARKRSLHTPSGGRSMTITSLALGLVAALYSVVHLLNTPGGFGTGGGKAGAVIGLILGCVGALISGLTLSRSRKNIDTR